MLGEISKAIKNELPITDEIEFDRCHRIGTFHRNKCKPQTVVKNVLRFKDKKKVLQNSKKNTKRRNLHL